MRDKICHSNGGSARFLHELWPTAVLSRGFITFCSSSVQLTRNTTTSCDSKIFKGTMLLKLQHRCHLLPEIGNVAAMTPCRTLPFGLGAGHKSSKVCTSIAATQPPMFSGGHNARPTLGSNRQLCNCHSLLCLVWFLGVLFLFLLLSLAFIVISHLIWGGKHVDVSSWTLNTSFRRLVNLKPSR